MRLHPYSLALGIGIGVTLLIALRHIPFSVLSALVSTIVIDMGLKAFSNDNKDED